MKTIGMIAAALAMTAATPGYGASYYVDANNGNDAWDGTTAVIPDPATIEAGGTIAGPRKTLHAMMSDARVVAGDTVWAAEGDYNEGGDVNGTEATSNRVQVKGGVMLCASGAREATFISGANGIDGAYSNGAVRCVFFLPPPSGVAYGIVKGFTVRNGRTCSTSEHGGASTGAGLMVACDFQNNGCQDKSRGGTMNGGYALRCKFTSVNRAFQAYNGTRIVSSLILDGTFYSKCRIYNCTLLGSSGPRYSYTYNCLFVGTGAAISMQKMNDSPSEHYNTYSRSEFGTAYCTTNETCRVVTAAESPYDATTYRPLAGSSVIDASDISYYVAATNQAAWRNAAWLAEADKDYYGNDRCVNGAIDVGCGEAQAESVLTISDASGGLVVTGAAIGTTNIPEGSSLDLTFSRNFTSDRLCTGVEVNGEFHSFGGTTSDVPCSVTLYGVLGGVYNVAAVYETNQKDWYVSPTGDDSNKGYHKNCPRKTLVQAMKLATANAGHVVHAAAGTYDEGETWAGNCSNRVAVTKGVGLVADEWPLKETVIKGAADTTSEDRDANGNGPAAVRCVYAYSGGYVRGFKLTGGRTCKGDGTGAQGGGAYLNSGALVDCDVTGVGCAYRGPAVTGGTIIRCYVHGIACGSYQVFNGLAIVNSYLDDTCYSCSLVLSSTVKNQIRANSNTRIFNTYLRDAYRISEDSGKVVCCTNCAFSNPVASALTGGGTVTYDPETCIFNLPVSANVDTSNRRPKTAASVLVDAGSKEIYDNWFPAAWVQFKGKDFAGGQRIYNGQIDIGCGEYDWRPNFAALLGPRAVVSEMGPNVTTNDVPNIVVPEGESITVSMAPRSSSRETRYELTYTPEGGSPTVISEKSAEAFSYTLDGACTVQSLDGFTGFMFLIR